MDSNQNLKKEDERKSKVCLTCSYTSLPNSDYCEWCQSKIDSYEPDDKKGDE